MLDELEYSVQVGIRQRVLIHPHIHGVKIREGPLQRGCHPPDVAAFQWQFTESLELWLHIRSLHSRHCAMNVRLHVRAFKEFSSGFVRADLARRDVFRAVLVNA
jgi:hypothetical protein